MARDTAVRWARAAGLVALVATTRCGYSEAEYQAQAQVVVQLRQQLAAAREEQAILRQRLEELRRSNTALAEHMAALEARGAATAARSPAARLPECTAYRELASPCADVSSRSQLCQAAEASLRVWTRAVEQSPAAAPAIAAACTTAMSVLTPTCGRATVGAPADLTGAPSTFGVAECDAYAARACSCSRVELRPALCRAAHRSFARWSGQLQSSGSDATRARVVRGCTLAEAPLRRSCP